MKAILSTALCTERTSEIGSMSELVSILASVDGYTEKHTANYLTARGLVVGQ